MKKEELSLEDKVYYAKKIISNNFLSEYSFLYLFQIKVVKKSNIKAIAYTNGKNIYFNEEMLNLFHYNVTDITFIILHEIYHNIYKHTSFNYPIEILTSNHLASLYNIACDSVINFILREEPFFDNSSVLNKNLLRLKEANSLHKYEHYKYWDLTSLKFNSPFGRSNGIITNGIKPLITGFCYVDRENESLSVMEIYEKLKKLPRDNNPSKGDNILENAMLEELFNEETNNSQEIDAEQFSEQELEELREVTENFLKEKIEEKKNQGKESLGAFLEIQKLYSAPKEKWERILRKDLQKTLSKKLKISPISKIRRKIPDDFYVNNLVRKPTPTFFVIVDTSGSVSREELLKIQNSIIYLGRFFSCEDFTVVYCDTRISNVQHFTDPKKIDLKFYGGGGTCFEEPFLYLKEKKLNPSFIIYFTDMECYFPKISLDYKVFWGNTSKNRNISGEFSQKNHRVVHIE